MWYKSAQFFVQQYNPGNQGYNAPSVPPYTPPNQQSGQPGQGQQGQPQSQQQEQQPLTPYEQMIAAMKEGRMPVRNPDGSTSYLEKGLWSLQRPNGFGYFAYPTTYSNGATQQVYLSKQELNQGTMTNASTPQQTFSNLGADADKYAVVQEDQNTFVILPANLCTQTSAPMGAGWSQYMGVNGAVVYGAGPEDQSQRAQAIADAKANPQKQSNWQDYLMKQFQPYLAAAQQQSQGFNNAYNKMLAQQAREQAQANGNEESASPNQHSSNLPSSMGRKHR